MATGLMENWPVNDGGEYISGGLRELFLVNGDAEHGPLVGSVVETSFPVPEETPAPW